MRTKTILLSALLGTIGSVSLMAQSSTNVYSLNAVGYINVSLQPGFNLISCPLIASPDNTINTLFTNSTGAFKKSDIYNYYPSLGAYSEDIGTASGWADGGTNTLNPGQAVWFFNPSNLVLTVTFVGTVPSGSLPNPLVGGAGAGSFNLVSSILPTTGDLVTNSLMNFTNASRKDQLYYWNTSTANYTEYLAGAGGVWPAGNPQITNIASGFFYYTTNTFNWVENFTVGQ
jgi:hypothetical protein